MKLEAYLHSENLAPSQFAERIGVPASTISRIIKLKRTPRPETIARIRDATGGKVDVADWYAPETASGECAA